MKSFKARYGTNTLLIGLFALCVCSVSQASDQPLPQDQLDPVVEALAQTSSELHTVQAQLATNRKLLDTNRQTLAEVNSGLDAILDGAQEELVELQNTSAPKISPTKISKTVEHPSPTTKVKKTDYFKKLPWKKWRKAIEIFSYRKRSPKAMPSPKTVPQKRTSKVIAPQQRTSKVSEWVVWGITTNERAWKDHFKSGTC